MTTVAHASYRPKNKTIVRSLMNSLPGWIGHYAPALATPVAVSLFRITPARRSGPDRERALLSAARRRDLQFQGSTVATWQWGDTHRPLVLLVHGWGGRGGQFHPFVQPLLDAHYQVVTFDALGHGASDRRTSDLVVMTHSLQAVAAHFGPIHAIIAHSLGAATTALALREGLAVEKLVLISPAAQPERFPLHFLRAFGLEGDRLSRARLWFEAVVGRSLAEVSTLDNLAAVGPLETLILHDSDDRVIPLPSAQTLGALDHTQLQLTQGLGHMRILNDPGVVKASLDFLGPANPELSFEELFELELRKPHLRWSA